MCKEIPRTALAMDARHCAGSEMHDLMAYGASVGSNKAKKEKRAKVYRTSLHQLLIILVEKRIRYHATCFYRFC